MRAAPARPRSSARACVSAWRRAPAARVERVVARARPRARGPVVALGALGTRSLAVCALGNGSEGAAEGSSGAVEREGAIGALADANGGALGARDGGFVGGSDKRAGSGSVDASGDEGAGGAPKARVVDGSVVGGEVSRPKAVLSEEELLPPSKREPRGKELKEAGGEGERVGGKEGSDKDGDDGKSSGGTTKTSAGGATKVKTKTETKPKTDASEKKLAAPRSAPPPNGGSIKSAAGMSMDIDSDSMLSDFGSGDGGNDDARSGGGGGGGGDDDEEDEDDEDDDEVVLRTPWYELAWIEMEAELTKVMQRLLNIWITRDPSKTTRLVFFSLLGSALFLAALLLYPENPLEFSDEGLFASVFGRNPRWVINRELGPLQPTLLSTTCACAVAFAKVRLGANMFKLSPFMHGVLGLPMGFMLVFRWNNAHERWWYGRTCLGNILLYCKNLGGTFCTWVAPDDPMLAARALGLIGALKETVADRLNGTVLSDGAILSQLTTPLDARDLEGLFLAENKVLFCIEALRGCVQEAFKKGHVPPAIASTIHNEVALIMDNYGSCEKVVNQPPPGCIITHLKSTLMVYVCSLPMILVHEVGVWGVVPVTTILSLALFGIEAAAEQIEQPFGNRPYDLPVRALMNSNGRDLEQTSRKVLGMAGYVNGVKMPFVPDAPVMVKTPDAKAKEPVKALIDADEPTPVKKPAKPEALVVPPPPAPSAAQAVVALKKPSEPESSTAVIIPATRKDNTVSLSSERLEPSMSSVATRETPFSFSSDSVPSSSADPVKNASQNSSSDDSISSDDAVPMRSSTPPPASVAAAAAAMSPNGVKKQTVYDIVPHDSTSRDRTPLSPLRSIRVQEQQTPSISARKGELPTWKAQSPIEIYDQVLDERPSSTIPDSPRYHTQKSLRRRDSYGQQFFDMFARYAGGSSDSKPAETPSSPSPLERTMSSTLPRSNSAATLSPFRPTSEGERDIRDIPFQRSAFAPSPSKSDFVAGSEESGVPVGGRVRDGFSGRSTSLTDMSALEEAIKRAREARKRGGPSSP